MLGHELLDQRDLLSVTPEGRAELTKKLDELHGLASTDWRSITSWAEETRVLIRAFYENQLEEFNTRTKLPTVVHSFNLGQPKRPETYEAERAAAAKTYKGLVAFIQRLVNLPVPVQVTPMSTAHAKLAAKLEELKKLTNRNSENWGEIQAWGAGTEILIEEHFPKYLAKFEKLCETPHFISSPFASFDGEDDLGAADADRKAHAALAKVHYDKLVSFVQSLVDHASPGPAQHAGPTTSITNTYNFPGANVGALATGGSTATGSAHVGASAHPSQEQYVETVKKAKKALVDDEEKLQPIELEVLQQFLRIAQQQNVAVTSLAEGQKKILELAEETWAKNAAKEMKPPSLSDALEVIKTLASNPLMQQAVKFLVTGSP